MCAKPLMKSLSEVAMKKISKSAQIRALYEQGMNNTQIAEALGFKRNYVVQITGNCRRTLKASTSIEMHGKPAYFSDVQPSPYAISTMSRCVRLVTFPFRWVWNGERL